MSYLPDRSTAKRRPLSAPRQLRRKVLQAAGNDLDAVCARFEQEMQCQAEAHQAEIEQLKQFAEERCAQIVQRQVDHDNQLLAVYEDNLRTVLAENEELQGQVDEGRAEIKQLQEEREGLITQMEGLRQRVRELETDMAYEGNKARQQRKEKRRWSTSSDTSNRNRSGGRRGPG